MPSTTSIESTSYTLKLNSNSQKVMQSLKVFTNYNINAVHHIAIEATVDKYSKRN